MNVSACLLGKLSLHVALVMQNFSSHLFHWNICGCFYICQKRCKFLEIWVSKLIAQFTEPYQHGVVPEIWWKMGVNVGMFHNVGYSSRYLLTSSLTLSFQYLISVSWPSTTTLQQDEGLERLSHWKNSESSISPSGLTHCHLNLNPAGGVPPRPNRMQWTLAAATVFEEQSNSFCRTLLG